jgi:hypothetical protein
MAVGPIPVGKAATKTVKAATPIASTAGKTQAAKTTTTGGYSNIPASRTTTTGGYSGVPQTINVYGSPATNARPVTGGKSTGGKSTGGKTGGSTAFGVPGGADAAYDKKIGFDRTTNTYTPTETPTKTIVSRIPRLDSKGKIIGWDLVYSDGTTGFEPNPAYGQEEEDTKGTTNVQVLKGILLAKGLPADLVDDSVSFLQTLLKDGIDAESAITIYLNNKDFTTKSGTTVKSPFYTKYGFYNDALTEKYDASTLFNTVEGYKGVVNKYNVNAKFASTDYIQKYLKNKRSVADLDTYANTARLKAISADPNYVASLRAIGAISAEQDLTDFYFDPNVGAEVMKQNINAAAFTTEAVRRANMLTPLDTTRTKQIAAQLTAQGLSEAQVTALASQGYENIAGTLEPMTKYSGIYEGAAAKPAKSIQEELEEEEFRGLESQRRKRLAEQNVRAFQGQSGLTSQSLSMGSTSGII